MYAFSAAARCSPVKRRVSVLVGKVGVCLGEEEEVDDVGVALQGECDDGCMGNVWEGVVGGDDVDEMCTNMYMHMHVYTRTHTTVTTLTAAQCSGELPSPST